MMHHSQTVAAPSHVVPSERELKRTFRSAPHRMLDIGHSKVASWTFGPGPETDALDVLFIHGWPLDGATFRRIVPYLAGAYRCHVIDLPGVGQTTSSPGAPIDFISHAASVQAAADALGLDRYAVLAHDSGGFVARLLAAEDPRVTGLVLSDTEIPGHTPALVIAFALLARTPVATLAMRAMLRSGLLRRSALGFGGCFEDPAYVEGDFFELFIQPMLASDRAAWAQLSLLTTLHKGTMAALERAHPRVRVPVQLIWGSDDPFFPIEKAKRMAPQLGGPVTFETIPGAKLFPHEDHAETFARLARPFLAKLAARA